MKNDSQFNKPYPEGNEYQNKKFKDIVPNSFKFTAIMFLILSLILPFIAYSTFNDLVQYEQGGNIRINEIFWMFYQIGGAKYGKIIVVFVFIFSFLIGVYQTKKYWKEYKIEKN